MPPFEQKWEAKLQSKQLELASQSLLYLDFEIKKEYELVNGQYSCNSSISWPFIRYRVIIIMWSE